MKKAFTPNANHSVYKSLVQNKNKSGKTSFHSHFSITDKPHGIANYNIMIDNK